MIKNTQIHEGLKDKEIRDYLSVQMLRSMKDIRQNKKQIIAYFEKPPFEWAIKNAEAETRFHAVNTCLLKEQQAIDTLITKQGWDQFDVSDITAKDASIPDYMDFLGTQKEYDEFIKKTEKATE